MATPKTLRIGITGASGYIGRALVGRSLPPAWSVVSLGRRPLSPLYSHRHADINQGVPANLIEGLDAVIHLAADTGNSESASKQELPFALALASLAQRCGIPLLFVSSQTASANAPSTYGRTKAAIEGAILPLGAIVIRPGLVYGGEERGLFGLLTSIPRRFRTRLWLLPSPQVQPIHVDDLARAMVAVLAEDVHRGQVFNVADRPIAFNEFIGILARYRVRRGFQLPAPVPVAIARLLLVVGGRIFGSRLNPARLDSLTRLTMMDSIDDLARLGIVPRDLRDGLSFSGKPHRRLLIEARALARALTTQHTMPLGLLRRYVRALSMQGQLCALELPPVLLRFPSLLASLDRVSQRQSANCGTLLGRMDLMCRLCESEPKLASLFICKDGRGSRARVVCGLVKATLEEVQARVLFPFARLLAGSGS